jgi:hypothetical protein
VFSLSFVLVTYTTKFQLCKRESRQILEESHERSGIQSQQKQGHTRRCSCQRSTAKNMKSLERGMHASVLLVGLSGVGGRVDLTSGNKACTRAAARLCLEESTEAWAEFNLFRVCCNAVCAFAIFVSQRLMSTIMPEGPNRSKRLHDGLQCAAWKQQTYPCDGRRSASHPLKHDRVTADPTAKRRYGRPTGESYAACGCASACTSVGNTLAQQHRLPLLLELLTRIWEL